MQAKSAYLRKSSVDMLCGYGFRGHMSNTLNP